MALKYPTFRDRAAVLLSDGNARTLNEVLYQVEAGFNGARGLRVGVPTSTSGAQVLRMDPRFAYAAGLWLLKGVDA